MAIFGQIGNLGPLRDLSSKPFWHYVLAWMSQLNENAIKNANDFTLVRHPLIKAFVKRQETAKQAGGKYEAHRLHADLHYCLSGGEIILVAPAAAMKEVSKYDPESDNIFLRQAGKPREIIMRPGDIAVLLPADAHQPAQFDGSNQWIVKVVIKLPIDLLSEISPP